MNLPWIASVARELGPLPRRALVGLVMLLGVPLSLRAATPGAESGFGQALDASQGTVTVPADPAFNRLPLTVECRVKLLSKAGYNILVANETKASATHWELFTTPGDGMLHAYLPGRRPDHVHTQVVLADGQWHWVALVMEERRVGLYVDGREATNALVQPPTGRPAPGPLAFGALVEGQLLCDGLLDEVRISAGVRPIQAAPRAELTADEVTLGLWHFAAGAPGHDSSRFGRDGQFKPRPRSTAPGSQIPGGMPTALQPLPPAENVGRLRAALSSLASQLGLRTVKADQIQDAVLREWNHDFIWQDKKEYPEHRGGGPAPDKLKREVYDPQALAWATDGGPVGTVLRRTGALLADLKRAPAQPDLATLAEDYRVLQTAYAAANAAPASEQARAFYLAACAIRRQAALSNPLLDFHSILCVARGTFEGSVRSNPTTADVQGGHFVTQYFGFNALPGGGLFLVRNFRNKPEVINLLANSVVQNGRLKGRRIEGGAFATPDLSFDGKTIVFAWTENAEHKWVYSRKTSFHLFKVNVDGSNLTQLTDGDENDFDPCWLPNGRVAFSSERRGGYIRCFAAYLKVRSYTLFSMRDDGSDLAPLSFFETSEWNPTVNNEGQIVFTRWDYVDRENCLGTRFWICNPDGTNPRSPHGNYPLPYHTFPDHQPWQVAGGRELDSRIGAPLVEMGVRAVPNSPLYVFTAAPHHGAVFGSLCLLDLRQPDDHHMSQIKRLTPDEAFPESEMSGRRHYKYGTPWPLSESFFLCNVWENLALVDRYGNKELLCDLRALPCPQDERLRLIDPIPLRPRPTPPVIPPATRLGNPAATNATIAVMNAYDSDLPFPPGTRLKWLRVVQNIPKANHAMGEPMIGYERENTPRLPLGIVPIEEDGSAYFEAPVAKQLIFQVLDENFMAVQSMRSVAFAHPGEQMTCLGCHEPTHQSARSPGAPLALRRAPSKLQPECGPLEPISYYRQIKPIFAQRCLPCHLERKKGPQEMSYEKLKEGYTFWFAGAMWSDMCSAYSGVHGGSRTIPGRFGARYSKIGQALLTEPHRQAVSLADRHQVGLWLDCNSLRLGSYRREEAQLKGELVWPELDVDPRNIAGVEGVQPGLRGRFWHENAWGPRSLLVSEHAHDRVVILDPAGRIVWEYPVAHPQDVWMLPNGHILTTYAQGVKEVTRDKRVVWEYRTQAPNEIPNCQPLPDGNVLIGIVGECRLIEVNGQGAIVHQVQLRTTEKTPHAQFRMCRKTPEGTYLVPFMAEGAVREYDRQGKVLREFPRRPSPVCALRIEEGHTLITADRAVTEYDRQNRIVWELNEQDLPDIEIGVLAGLHRLPNGNTLVCNWNTKDTKDRVGAHIFEVTPDKRVVWTVTGTHLGQVAQCQVVTE